MKRDFPDWIGNAIIKACYRYVLTRTWDPTLPKLGFIMLNPSKATALHNDPTIIRCMMRAYLMGYGGIIVVNLFAYRSTDRHVLKTLGYNEAVGPENDLYLVSELIKCKMVIAGWGNDGGLFERDLKVKQQLQQAGIVLHALKISKDGNPYHPLYMSYKRKPIEFLPFRKAPHHGR